MLIALKIFRGQKMKIYLLKLRQSVPVILFTLLMTSCATQTTLLNESYDAEVMETGNDAFFIGGIGQTARHVDPSVGRKFSFTPARDPTSPFRPCVAEGACIERRVWQGTSASFGFGKGVWRPWVILFSLFWVPLGSKTASTLK